MDEGTVELRILVVEDDPGDCRAIEEHVRDVGGSRFHIVWTDRLDGALERLERESFDAVVFDLALPDSGGYETFARIRERVPHAPLVILTGLADDGMGVRTVASGGQDYLVTGQVGDGALRRAIRFAVERQKIRVAQDALSNVDELTGLHNRRGFLASADHLLRLSRRRGSGLWLLFADLDGLKTINDRFGHRAGDAALVETANALRGTFRSTDVIGRLGGDEFAVLALDAAEGSRELLVERLEENVARVNASGSCAFTLGLSVGAARYDPPRRVELSDLLMEADQALYDQKRRRRETGTTSRDLP